MEKKLLIVGNLAKDIIRGKQFFGGSAGVIAINATRLGIKSSILSVIGNDQFSKKYLDFLKATGVDITHVYQKVKKIPVCEIEYPFASSLKRVWHDQGALEAMSALKVDGEWINSFTLIHLVSCPPVLARKISEVITSDVCLSYEPGPRILHSSAYINVKILKKTKLLFANEEEIRAVLKVLSLSSVEEIFHLGVEAIVITRGKDGSTIYFKVKSSILPLDVRSVDVKAPVVKVIDPTGAGDAYRVGFFYGYLRGFCWKRCGNLGAKFAAEKLGQLGGIIKKRSLENFRMKLFSS